jgi:hypothetical protein
MLCFVGMDSAQFQPSHIFFNIRYGFGSYFNLLLDSEWSALLLTYGFPLTIIGMALKARNLLYVRRHLQKGPYDWSVRASLTRSSIFSSYNLIYLLLC